MMSEPNSLLEDLPLHDDDLAQRRALAGFTRTDADCLAAIWPTLQSQLETLVAAHVRRQAEMLAIAAQACEPATLERFRCAMTGYIAELFGGVYEAEYAAGRLRIGFVHRRNGLAARYFLAALHCLHVDLRHAIATRVADAAEAARATAALERLLLFDQSLILDGYVHRLAAEARREHDRALRYAGSLEEQVAARTRALEQLLRADPLTGLRNRRAFREELYRELNRAQRQLRPLSALYIDVDDFKTLNDRDGHARGDEVLIAIAGALSAVLRDVDIAARLGGDEFCLLLPDTDAGQAAHVAERLRSQVRQVCPVGVSIGIATLEVGDYADPDALVRRADQAMYRDKGRASLAVRRVGRRAS